MHVKMVILIFWICRGSSWLHFFIIRNQLPSLSKLGTSLPFVLLFCLMPQLLCMLTINRSFMIAKNCLLHYLCMIFLLKPILLLHFVWFCITHVWIISQIRKTYVSASPWRFNLYYLSINIKISLAVLNTLRFLFYNTELRPHSNVC